MHIHSAGSAAVHIVQFYEGEDFLLSRIVEFLREGFGKEEPAVVIGTATHVDALRRGLAAQETQIGKPESDGRLILLDAAETLATFMVGKTPDPQRFRTTLQTILTRPSLVGRPIRAFGEMVALLWQEGNRDGASALEALWEDFLSDREITLLCAYPIDRMHGIDQHETIQNICKRHSHVLPSESYSAPHLSDQQRMREVALLQQKAAGLEAQSVEMKRQLEDLQQLQEMSLRLPSINSLDETLREILRCALAVYGTDKGALSLTVSDGSGLKVAASIGFPEAFLEAMQGTLPSGIGASGLCLATREPVIVDDATTDPILASFQQAVELGEVRAVHSIPLINRQGKVIGVLCAHFPSPHRPGLREKRFAEVYARLAADSIEQAELRADAKSQTHTLEILNGTSEKLVAEHDIEKIVQAVTDGGREITKAAFGAFFYNVKNDQGESFTLYTLSGASREAFSKFPMPRKTALFAHTFDGKGPQRFDDVLKQSEYGKSPPYHGMPKGHLPVRSYLSVPVISRTGEVLGGLFYGHPEPGVFTERSERLLVNLASQAAVAIDNARLHSALQSELQRRKEREEAAQKFAAIVSSSSDAIVSKDLQSIVKSWNKGAERLFGYTAEEMIGKPITLLIPEDHIDEEPRILERIGRGETIEHYETVRRRKDGTLIDISLTVSPIVDDQGMIIGASKIARDITDRKQFEIDLKSTEEQLRQAQKMEAVGRLAGGIAHDFNNLLTSINGFTDMAMAQADDDSLLFEYLQEVKKSGERAALLTQQLLAYSRKQILSPKILNLNTIVSELEKMLPRLIGEDIAFRTMLDPDLAPVKADPGQMHQIIMNLALNARDAMPTGGSFIIRTFIEPPDSSVLPQLPDAPPVPHVVLEVTDTGVGMTPGVQSRIFEPFFTTKEVGKGTGLGLSSVYGIVKQSGGVISVESSPGKGSTFRIIFPAAAGKSNADGIGDAPGQVVRTQRAKIILLVEDEDSVRRFLVTTLRRRGYTVLEAQDGAQGLAIGAREPHIDLLLTDVVMPHMNGGELAAKLKAVKPAARILFISGYTKDVLSRNAPMDPDMGFLQKPFTQNDLIAKVGEILNVRA